MLSLKPAKATDLQDMRSMIKHEVVDAKTNNRPIIVKLIIAGSRHLNADIETIDMCLEFFDLEPTEIVCGCAKGIDSAGEQWAIYMKVHVEGFCAEWDKYGKRAGHLRNGQMADYGDALLLIWDGQSKGSANMKKQMEDRGKPVYEIVL